MSLSRPAPRGAVAAAACAAVAGGLLVPLAAAAAPASAAVAVSDTARVKPTDDAYIEAEAPNRNTGTADKLVASTDTRTKTMLLRFKAPRRAGNPPVVRATLELSTDRAQASRVDVKLLASNTWDEAAVTAGTAPAVRARVATAGLSGGSSELSVDVTKAVRAGSVSSFAVTVPSGTAVVASKETGWKTAPKLVVDYGTLAKKPMPAPKPAPEPAPEPKPAPEPAPEPKPAPEPAPEPKPAPEPAPAPSSRTMFGTNVYRDGGENYRQALDRQQTKYGRLDIVRAFYPGLPAAWPGNAGMHDGPVVVSFKARPVDVLAGKHDAQLEKWFATAPRDRHVGWTYFHEPEDDIARGSFTAAEYRAAWRHLDGLAAKAKNPQLKATTVLMCWSLAKNSGRNWKDYYPGSDVIDELGWDCYNTAWDNDRYLAPSRIFGAAKAASDSVGKPFGIAEMGSPLIASDPTGTKRAAWLRTVAQWLDANGAAWATYFDAPIGHEYRLFDKPSVSAWKWAVSDL